MLVLRRRTRAGLHWTGQLVGWLWCHRPCLPASWGCGWLRGRLLTWCGRPCGRGPPVVSTGSSLHVAVPGGDRSVGAPPGGHTESRMSRVRPRRGCSPLRQTAGAKGPARRATRPLPPAPWSARWSLASVGRKYTQLNERMSRFVNRDKPEAKLALPASAESRLETSHPSPPYLACTDTGLQQPLPPSYT